MFENEDVILPDDFQEAPPQAEETPVETVEESVEETTEQTEQLTDTTEQPIEQPSKIKVKYNHQEMELPVDDAVPLIQKGMNYDKVHQQVSQYQQRLEQIAQITGYQTTDELFQAMEQAQQEQEAERYRQAGIDPQAFNQLLENNPEIQYARQMRAKQEADQRFQSEANELFQAFPDLKPEQIPPEVWQAHSQGIPLKFAYMQHEYGQLKSQVQVLKQNKQNEDKAPIQGVSGHGSTEIAADDDFLKGFNSN